MMETTVERGYRAPVVSRIAGLTYRQLDDYARNGLLIPSVAVAEGSGSRRLYSPNDVLMAMAVRKLLRSCHLGFVREHAGEVRDAIDLHQDWWGWTDDGVNVGLDLVRLWVSLEGLTGR